MLLLYAQVPKVTSIDTFNGCLSSLDQQSLSVPRLGRIIEEIKTVPIYSHVSWNVNRRFIAGAINILVPKWDDTFWPGSLCGGLPKQPADCVTSPRDKFIICNPAVGRQLDSFKLDSAIAATSEVFATHFLLLAILGHELGHIQIGSRSQTQHLIRYRSLDGLKCYHTRGSNQTEEMRADEIGLRLACDAIRRRQDFSALPTEVGDVLWLLTRLEDQLDEGYFAMDDLCTGDEKYPSISRRKDRIASEYLSCLYPRMDWGLLLLNQGITTNLGDIDSWLTDRQVGGQIASGNYGLRPLSDSKVVNLPGTQLTYDSTDSDSSVWSVTRRDDGSLKTDQLLKWNRTGSLVRARSDGTDQQWLIQLGESKSPEAIDVTIHCTASACLAKQREKAIPDATKLVANNDELVSAVTASSFQVYGSVDELFAARPLLSIEHQLKAGPDQLMPVPDKDRAIILKKKNGGLYNVAVADKAGVHWDVILTVPFETGRLESATRIEDRLLLSFSTEQLDGIASISLWDCPFESFFDKNSGKVECFVYAAPREMINSVALATRDNSAAEDFRIESVCGGWVAVHRQGWLWVIDRINVRNDLLVANGIAGCPDDKDTVSTFRARRVDRLKMKMTPVSKGSASFVIVHASGPPEADRQ
jgi:hypothetical protein